MFEKMAYPINKGAVNSNANPVALIKLPDKPSSRNVFCFTIRIVIRKTGLNLARNQHKYQRNGSEGSHEAQLGLKEYKMVSR